MKSPAQFAAESESRPELPYATCERVSGYGVMGQPFASGHILGLRRWTASSIGAGFTSIWHRDPAGTWTFYETEPDGFACSRYFGGDADRLRIEPIHLEWLDQHRLRIRTASGSVDWTVEMQSSTRTRLMSFIGPILPLAVWRWGPVLRGIGTIAGAALRVGRVQLTGKTSNNQHFDANPLRVWHVASSHATVEGVDVGPAGPLQEQAHMADFYFPQHGIFALGRVFVTPPPAEVAAQPGPGVAVRERPR